MKKQRWGANLPDILANLPDMLIEGVQHANRVISADAVREQTFNYLVDDYYDNSHKYSQYDRDRINHLIQMKRK